MSASISASCNTALLVLFALSCAVPLQAQTQAPDSDRNRELLDRIDRLEKRVTELQTKLDELSQHSSNSTSTIPTAVAPIPANAPITNNTAPSGAPVNPQPAAEHTTQTAPSTSQVINAAKPQPSEPFSFADFTWLTGNSRTTESPLETKVFIGELRVDTDYVYDFNHPADHSIGGSSEVFRSEEVQLTQFGIGGDFHWDNIGGRLMTQFAMYAETTPRNDASPARGRWDLDTAYRYISEAYGGYHFNKLDGINVDAGIFMSYVGLFSSYQFR
jgi:hypothetical protein